MQQQDDAGLTREDLRRELRKAGFRVSADQLERWHKAGLLVRPQRHALGRGKGTESRYPRFVVLQAVTVALLRRRLRSLDLISWYLLCCGFPPTDRARALLLRLAAKEHRDATKDLEEFEREEPGNRIEASATRRLPTLHGQMRRRVGRQFMPTLQRLWTEIAVGRQDLMSRLEKEDVSRLLRIEDPTTERPEVPSQSLDDNTFDELRPWLLIVLSDLSAALRTDTVVAALERAQDHVLEGVRDELQTLLTFAGYGRLGDNDVLAPPAWFLTYFQARVASKQHAPVLHTMLTEALEARRIPGPRSSPLVRAMRADQRRRQR